jgi:hypothetical protein
MTLVLLLVAAWLVLNVAVVALFSAWGHRLDRRTGGPIEARGDRKAATLRPVGH